MITNLPSSIHDFEEMVSQFDYDRAVPLQVKEHGIEQKNGVSIHDINFTSLGEGHMKAYWVLPPTEGAAPFPGVIFVHPLPGDRSTFLEEAALIAKQGIASLVVEMPWAQGEDFVNSIEKPEQARQAFTRVVKDLRRAVDFVVSRSEIDIDRLGYIGHSAGAFVGGVLSGVEKRIKAFVLVAGTGSFTDVAVCLMPDLQGQVLEHYAQVLEPIDPVYYLGRAAPSVLFFQVGRRDEFFPNGKLLDYAEAGSEPKFVKWYDTEHYFKNCEEAQRDRLEWLQEQL